MGQPRDFELDHEHQPAAEPFAHTDSAPKVNEYRDRSAVDAELDRFRHRLAAHRRSHLDLLDHVVEADAVELWMADGAPSMIEWLAWSHGMNRHTARTTVTVAHALGDLPALRTAYGAGILSWDQRRAAVEVATPGTEAELAAHMAPSEIRALARQVAEESEERIVEDRALHYWFHEQDPIFEMHIRMPDVEGATLITALQRRANLVDANPADGLSYDHSVRLVDALTQIASQFLAADADHDRATLIVRTDVPTLLAAPTQTARASIGRLPTAGPAGWEVAGSCPNTSPSRIAPCAAWLATPASSSRWKTLRTG
jgi:hypothetical protein